MKIYLFLPILLFFAALAAHAHPVPYEGAVGVMSWDQPFMSDDWVTYSFRHDAAVAFRHMRFDIPEGRMRFLAPQIDYLAKRWNETDYQANIYAYAALGLINFQDRNERAALAGVEADAESRKFYASAKYEKMWGGSGPDFYDLSARVGMAPYEAEFNEVASWFMIQYQYHPMLIRKYAITPLVRLFYKSVLFESGVSTDGDWMINFMFHF